jgi:hypothetical protein
MKMEDDKLKKIIDDEISYWVSNVYKNYKSMGIAKTFAHKMFQLAYKYFGKEIFAEIHTKSKSVLWPLVPDEWYKLIPNDIHAKLLLTFDKEISEMKELAEKHFMYVKP